MTSNRLTELIKLGNEIITIVPADIVQYLNVDKSRRVYLIWTGYSGGASIMPFTVEDAIKFDNKYNKEKKEERKVINDLEDEVRKTRLNVRNDGDYNEMWTEKLREAVRERDEHECQRCHRKQEEEVALDVHHINGDKENSFAELITLCPYCHKIVTLVTLVKKEEYRLEFLKILKQRNIVGWTEKYLNGDAIDGRF